MAGHAGGRGHEWLGPRHNQVCVGGAKAREAVRFVRAWPCRRRGYEVVCGYGGGLIRVWPGPQSYRSFIGEGQARETGGRAVGKGGFDDYGQVGECAEVNRDKVWGGRVGRCTAVNGGKVWLYWSFQKGFLKGSCGRGSSPRRSRGCALLDSRR